MTNFTNRTYSIVIQKEKFEPIKYKDPISKPIKLILLILGLIFILSWFYYHSTGLTLAYNDARSHLNISRRVVDSLQPGLAQLGTVWLPLPHILQLATIFNDFFYYSGLSGSIISILSAIFSSYLIAKISKILKFSDLTTFICLVIFALNPNFLYMQTTPMTESLMLFTTLFTTYLYIKWVKYGGVGTLVVCGIATFLAVLTRYDGWLIFIFTSIAVFLVSAFRFSINKALGNFILYSMIPAFAVFLWLMWNQLIFGNAFEFINGSFSAKSQQEVLLKEGRLLTKGSITESLFTYSYTIAENLGYVLALLSVIGIIVLFVRSGRKVSDYLMMCVFLVPIGFNVLSLFLGHSVIHLPFIYPYAYFNVRYGLMALPAIAFAVSSLTFNKKYLGILILTVVVLQYGYLYYKDNIITIKDAKLGASGFYLDDVGNWLHDNAKEGKILVATSSHDALIFTAHLPLKRYVSEGMSLYWKPSLENPSQYVRYVVMHDGDLVADGMVGNPDFENNFELVFKGEFSNVYEKQSNKD